MGIKINKNEKIKDIPNHIILDLEDLRKKFRSRVNFNNNDLNKNIKNCNFLIKELNYYKKELIGDKNKKKYSLNFEFPKREKNDRNK